MKLIENSFFVLMLQFCALFFGCEDSVFKVESPDKRLSIELTATDSLRYSVTFDGRKVLEPSTIGLELSETVAGLGPVVRSTGERIVEDTIRLPYGNNGFLVESYNEKTIIFEGGYGLVLRAYNEGVAYRFVLDGDDEATIRHEIANFNLAGNPSAILPETDTYTSWEVPYIFHDSIAAIRSQVRSLTPAMFINGKDKIVIAESDVLDYPGMYLNVGSGRVSGTWAAYPKKTELGSWGNFVSVVKEREDFIAKTNGRRNLPWRIVMVTDDDKSLMNNDLVYKLASPQRLADASWVVPGKAAWEWWHDAMLVDSDVPSGMDNRNTTLYKQYIDFAAEHGLEYLMLDAGWSDIFELDQVNKRVDVQDLIGYGNEKGVGLFLWCVATAIIDDLDTNMKLLSDWGVKGIKVDFIDRDDQEAITWFEKIAASAARYQLMVNFHGCSKPTGLERAYPNIVNYEAVRGAECSKWDYTANPEHHLVIPYLRMLAGPLDYTPGSMRNSTKGDFRPVDPGLPSTQGTRCHELAMYVFYDQPFAMLCDSPGEYAKYPDIMKYLSAVPTDFDKTVPLQGKVADYGVIAKQKGDEWFVAAMTDWEAREVKVDFSFLNDQVNYTAAIYLDGADANEIATSYTYSEEILNSNSQKKVALAPGGGAVFHLIPAP